MNMPLWNVYHPVGAYSAEDKQALAERITKLYTDCAVPKFYVGILFQELPKESFFIGARPVGNFVRIKVDQMARTLPTPKLREWWVRAVDEAIAPFVRDRGYDWEFHIDETPADLWSIQGELPPPFGSEAEKRWAEENKPSPYTLIETVALGGLAPGITVQG
jgi:phenylpyruvate tautomerase PptA (4-oxalocrotonate tautomerase family)